MTSKEMERKALEQIRKIVDGLGEGSYLTTAFEGCFEDAEYNIENDFACSMKDRVDSAEKKIEKLTADLAHVTEQSKYFEKKLREQEQQTGRNFQEATKYAERVRELETKLNAATAGQQEAQEAVAAATAEAQKTIDRQADEILHLKAKLYDLMTK